MKQKFDASVCESVLNEVINSSFEQALDQLALRIAGRPVFEIVEPVVDSTFTYNAVVDVYPSVTLPDLKPYKFIKLFAEVSDEDVNRTILVLRRQLAKWSPVDRASQTGDSVIINYYAQQGERVFDGKAMRVELNGVDILPGFESGLKGVSAGEKLPLDINFPEDHNQTDIAGKTLVFNVEVLRVEGLVLPEIDSEFIKSHGIESGKIEAFRGAIQHNMNVHLQKVVRMKNTLTILSEILKGNPVEVPQVLVDEEVTRLTCDPCEEVEGVDHFKHDMDPANFTGLAYNRVARSLLAAELASAKGIELDTDEVRIRLEDLVAEYSDKERIIAWFYEDKTRLAGIESDVLGEQVADWILENMTVEQVTTSYSEMMNLNDTINE